MSDLSFKQIDNIEVLEDDEREVFNFECEPNHTYIAESMVVHNCQAKEKTEKISLKVMKLLKEYDYPVAISTKNKRIVEPEYLKLLGDMKAVVQVSCINYENLDKLEPGASTPDERFAAVKKCNDSGIPAHLRLQPFIPEFINDMDEYIKRVRETGCKFVTIEHMKLPLDYTIISQISGILGYDIKKRFKQFSGAGGLPVYGREFELPPETKYKFLFEDGLVDKFHNAGIKLGMGDNQLHQYNDAKTCCGVDLYPGFEHYMKANYTHMMAQSNKERFTFDDLLGKHWIPKVSINDNMNRSIRWSPDNKCRYVDGSGTGKLGKLEAKDLVPNTIYYHLRNKWHNPRLNDSPSDLYLIEPRKTGKKFIDKITGEKTDIDEVVYVKKKRQKGLAEWI